MRNTKAAYPVLILLSLLSCTPETLFAQLTGAKAYSKQYTFTQDTFTDKIVAWSSLLKEFKGKPGVNYLEIGTFEGRSVLWLLENILTSPSSKILVIDAFEENSYKTFTLNVALSGEVNKFKIMSGFSTEKIKELPSNSI